jgi:hypothetical protein
LAAYLSGENEGELRRNTNALSTTWTNARKASTRREVEWTFENTKPSVSFDGKTLHDKHRRNVLSSLRISQRARHMTRLCEMPSQGKAMECVAANSASSHFFQTGLYTRFADWRFIHRARLNLLPLNGARRNIQNNANKSCRRCGYENKTLPHVIKHCMRYSQLITRRHTAVVNRVKKAAQGKHTILYENETIQGNLRRDLVIVKNNKATIIDITISFENRMEVLTEARQRKVNKYDALARTIQQIQRSES